MLRSLKNYQTLSRLFFVYKSFGEVIFKVLNFTSVVQRYVFRHENVKSGAIDSTGEDDAKMFSAESQSVLFLNPALLITEKEEFKEFHDFAVECEQPMATIFCSSVDSCRKCGKTLAIESKLHPVVVYSSQRGTYLGCRVTKCCRKCKIYEHYGFWTESKKKHYNEECISLDFILSSEDTAFEKTLLEECANLLVIGAVPFSTFAASYNRRFDYPKQTQEGKEPKVKRLKRETTSQLKDVLQQRQHMDRRRLEEAFLLQACLQTIQQHDLWENLSVIPYDKNEMVEKVTKEFATAFQKKWGDHSCNIPGCKKVLVLDGNMKNARQVCMLKQVGELHFCGMPGSVVVGCQNTPAKGKRYCPDHCETAMVFRDDDNKTQGLVSEDCGSLIVKILNDKQTRQGTKYQVLWADGRISWVQSDNLPIRVQEHLKKGEQYQQHPVYINELGQRRTEFTQVVNDIQVVDNVVVKSTGFAVEHDGDRLNNLSCGTEKGRHKSKNHRTAGVFAIAKPCGIVVSLKELYGSESKTQVYGHLHDLLQQPEMCDIESICYDDACHLKKFSLNPVRSSTTATSKRLAAMEMVVDKFHFRNHVDGWCKANCNPHNSNKLQDVNTEVCEQLFSWLSRFCHITNHMNRWRFLFLMLYIVDNHNKDVNRKATY